MATSTASLSQQYNYTNGGTYFPTPFHLQQPQAYIGDVPPPIAAVKVPSPDVATLVYPAPAPAPLYSFPQYQQAQHLFQKDAQMITPEAFESVKAAIASSEIEHKVETKKKALPRKAAGQTWEDPTLADWPENDYRLFCGDLGNEVNDDVLSKAFSRFPSFNMARGKDDFPSAREASICMKLKIKNKRQVEAEGKVHYLIAGERKMYFSLDQTVGMVNGHSSHVGKMQKLSHWGDAEIEPIFILAAHLRSR